MTSEFKKIKNNEDTHYVLETATAGATSAGVVATSPSKKREDSILAQEKKETPKPRNFVAKNAKMGGSGKMKDKSKTIPRKEKHKKPVAEGFNGEYNDEAGMAHTNLLTSARAVMGLLKTIDDKDNLPEWVQEKIAKAEMMLVGVWDYLQSQKEQGIDPQQDANEAYGRYDRRDAYQRDYDSSVSGMDRGNNHRDDERHDLDPSDWYIVKDGKMYKTSVYPNQEQEAMSRGYSRTREEAKSKSDNVAEGSVDEVAGAQKCWPGHRKTGTQAGTGKNAGKRVNNCEKIKEDDIEESGLQYHTGVKKHGKEYMVKAAAAGRDGASQKELGALKDKYSKAYKEDGVAEGAEDRTSYQVAKILADRGMTYDPAQENELINAIGMVLVKELMMTPKQARYLISYDEDFVSDTMGELRSMEQSVPEAAKKGLYYYVNKRKAAGTSRPASSSKAPTAQAWRDAAKTAKKESADPYFESLADKLDQLKKK